jgi:HTH-type transcriptional regulator/antitoxin HipB
MFVDSAALSSIVDIAGMSTYVDTMGAGANILNARSLPRLGTVVRRLRHDRGLSQIQLAEMAGVSRQWLINLEQGRTEGLQVGLLMRVLDVLDASLTIRDERGDH